MNKFMVDFGVVALIGMMVGVACVCGCLSPEEQREAIRREYDRLASLPPAKPIKSPMPEIANCSRQSCDLFNVAQPKMRAYIAKVETSREYTGFINDIRYYVEEKKMSPVEAQRKVRSAVIAADANRPDGEKVWPKILKGAKAARQFGSASERKQFAELDARYCEICAALGKISKQLRKMQKDLKHEKNKSVRMEKNAVIASRYAECLEVQCQLSDAGRCISFMKDQYDRANELED